MVNGCLLQPRVCLLSWSQGEKDTHPLSPGIFITYITPPPDHGPTRSRKQFLEISKTSPGSLSSILYLPISVPCLGEGGELDPPIMSPARLISICIKYIWKAIALIPTHTYTPAINPEKGKLFKCEVEVWLMSNLQRGRNAILQTANRPKQVR